MVLHVFQQNKVVKLRVFWLEGLQQGSVFGVSRTRWVVYGSIGGLIEQTSAFTFRRSPRWFYKLFEQNLGKEFYSCWIKWYRAVFAEQKFKPQLLLQGCQMVPQVFQQNKVVKHRFCCFAVQKNCNKILCLVLVEQTDKVLLLMVRRSTRSFYRLVQQNKGSNLTFACQKGCQMALQVFSGNAQVWLVRRTVLGFYEWFWEDFAFACQKCYNIVKWMVLVEQRHKKLLLMVKWAFRWFCVCFQNNNVVKLCF